MAYWLRCWCSTVLLQITKMLKTVFFLTRYFFIWIYFLWKYFVIHSFQSKIFNQILVEWARGNFNYIIRNSTTSLTLQCNKVCSILCTPCSLTQSYCWQSVSVRVSHMYHKVLSLIKERRNKKLSLCYCTNKGLWKIRNRFILQHCISPLPFSFV